MKKILFLSLLALTMVGCSSEPKRPNERTPEFLQADSNADGLVSLPEWMRFGGKESVFRQVDAKNKGWLDEAQFREALRINDQLTGNSGRAQMTLDQQISADVKARLESSMEVNGWNVNVNTYQGTVTLTGAVRSLREKAAAERTAAAVQGVKAVFNQIEIRE